MTDTNQFHKIRRATARLLEQKCPSVRSAYSGLDGVPPDRRLDVSECPAVLVFRGTGAYRRRTLEMARHRVELRLEILIGPFKGRAEDTARLERVFDEVALMVHDHPTLDGTVISAMVVRDEGEQILRWGRSDYLGSTIVLDVYYDIQYQPAGVDP